MIRLVLQVKNGVGLTFPFRLGQGANCLPHGSRSLTALNYELEAQLQIGVSDFNSGIRILIGDPIPNRGSKFNSGLRLQIEGPTPIGVLTPNRASNFESEVVTGLV